MSKQSKFQYLIHSLLLALLIGGLIMWATGGAIPLRSTLRY